MAPRATNKANKEDSNGLANRAVIRIFDVEAGIALRSGIFCLTFCFPAEILSPVSSRSLQESQPVVTDPHAGRYASGSISLGVRVNRTGGGPATENRFGEFSSDVAIAGIPWLRPAAPPC